MLSLFFQDFALPSILLPHVKHAVSFNPCIPCHFCTTILIQEHTASSTQSISPSLPLRSIWCSRPPTTTLSPKAACANKGGEAAAAAHNRLSSIHNLCKFVIGRPIEDRSVASPKPIYDPLRGSPVQGEKIRGGSGWKG
jgi:hypothetical protein